MKKNTHKKPKKMSRLGNDIALSLEELAAHKRGEKTDMITYRFPQAPEVDVKSIRQKLNMTQEQFTRFGFSLSAIRHWEANRRRPEGPARILLKIIESHPKMVLDTLHR